MSGDDGLGCCRGEPGPLHPKAYHSPGCPVYRANCEALDRYYARRDDHDGAPQPPTTEET